MHKEDENDKASQVNRQRIARMGSKAFRWLLPSVVLLLLVLVINIALTFALSDKGSTAFLYTFDKMSVSSSFSSSTNRMDADLSLLYDDSLWTEYYSYQWWHQRDYPMLQWDNVPVPDFADPRAAFNHALYLADAWEVLSETLRHAKLVQHRAHRGLGDLYNDAHYRYLMDNLDPIHNATAHLAQLFTNAIVSTADRSVLVLVVAVPTSLATIVAAALVFYARSLHLIDRERRETLRLFLQIPRSLIRRHILAGPEDAQGLQKQQQHQQDEEVAEDSATAVQYAETRLAAIKSKSRVRITLMIAGGSVVLLAILFSLFGLTVSTVNATLTPVDVIYKRAFVYIHERRVGMLANVLALNDTLSVPFRSRSIGGLLGGEIRAVADAKAAANEAVGFFALDIPTPAIREFVLNTNCSAILENHSDVLDGAWCVGMNAIDNQLLDTALRLIAVTAVGGNATEALADLNDLENYGVFPWHRGLEAMLLAHYRGGFDVLLLYGRVVFALSWPTVLAVFALWYSPLQRVRREYKRTLQMLLMIPPKVADTVPQIKRFLETGEKSSAQKHLLDVLHKTQTKTERILQAAADAIVIYDPKTFVIETTNPAALNLFGFALARDSALSSPGGLRYELHELVGKPLDVILPAEYLGSQEDLSNCERG
eukprot:m51a1_g13091 hypothetical protein (655) ;mRNA; f:355-2712